MIAPPTVRTLTPSAPLWHVGFPPRPWGWAPWQYAGGARWDDAEQAFRTVYAAESRYGCYVEVLATFRPDPALIEAMAAITVDPVDELDAPTDPPGTVPSEWAAVRRVSSATVTGRYVDVTSAETIAALRPSLVATARSLGLPDFDAAALKLAAPRELTQRVASFVYGLTDEPGELVAGVRFASRHGDDIPLWAIFERPSEPDVSARVAANEEGSIDPSDPELLAALRLHGLRWSA